MKTYEEILVEDASAFLIEQFDVEEVTYIRPGDTTREVRGQGAAAMATAGVLTGSPADMAVAGVIEEVITTQAGRTISALVNRQGVEDLEGAPEGKAPVLHITVLNSATAGIASYEVDISGDKISVPVRLGETAQEMRITKILSQDAGMLKLELR